MELRKDTSIELKIENLAYGGKGVGRVNGFVVFVAYGVPGDTLRARITTKKQNHAEAEIDEILAPSPLRVDASCELFSICGGCCLQNIAYENQVIFKEQIVKSTIEHLAGLRNFKVRPIVASPEIWNYRNKMDLTFGCDQGEGVQIGFHKPGSYHEIVDVGKCRLQPEGFDTITGVVRRFAREHALSAYDPQSHTGLLRHLVIRSSRATGEIIAVLLAGEPDVPQVERLASELRVACAHMKGFTCGLNTGLADVAQLEDVIFQDGDITLTDTIGNISYRISPFSFFQTNTLAAERLFECVLDACDLSGKEILLDAYCGTGAIGIYCARKAQKVFGIDINVQAIWDARRNARSNGFTNCTFLAGYLRESLNLLQECSKGSIHRVILDPPRGGMDKKSLRTLLELNAPVVVYVSCNPSILARDLTSFIEAGYTIEYLQPLDMFPHTYHIETVAKLRKR